MKTSLYYLRELFRYIRSVFYFIKVKLRLYKKVNVAEEFSLALLEQKWPYKNPECVQLSLARLETDMEIYLSIIVPLYNSERYLSKLVEMLAEQKTSYKYEVVFVDDGSTDSTFRIVKDMTAMYQNFYCYTKCNGGIADARNYGLTKVHGRYVSFIDHDDEVSLDFVQIIINSALMGNYKIIKGRYYQKYDNEQIGPFSTKGYIWGGAFDRNLFQRVQFPVGFWYEDMINNFLITPQTKQHKQIDDALYYKNSTKTNASKKIWDANNYKCLEHVYLVYSLIDDYKKLGLDDMDYLFQRVLLECSGLAVSRTKKLELETRKQVFLFCCKLVRENDLASLKHPVLSRKQELFYDAFKKNDFRAWELSARI